MSVAALRATKAALIAAVALWAAASLFHNLHNWSATLGAVRAVTSMTALDSGAGGWQATSNPLVVWLGALFIAMGKLATAVLCSLAAARMWQARYAAADVFGAARRTALVGCGIAVFMLFAGFVVVAEVWFELWRSESLRGPVLASALRYAAMIALVALFTAAPEP